MTKTKECAVLMNKDVEILEELVGRMHSFIWEVDACGRDGHVEMEKIKQMAPKVIKVLVNYI